MYTAGAGKGSQRHTASDLMRIPHGVLSQARMGYIFKGM